LGLSINKIKMVFDPIKRATATVRTNAIGAIAGGIAGVMLVRRYMPTKGWLVMSAAILGGALGGAYAQGKLKAYSGSKKSGNQAK
jgi:hypothetical protein